METKTEKWTCPKCKKELLCTAKRLAETVLPSLDKDSPKHDPEFCCTRCQASRRRAKAEFEAMLYDADMNEWYGRGNW